VKKPAAVPSDTSTTSTQQSGTAGNVPMLLVVVGKLAGKIFPVGGPESIIGRSPDAGVVLDEESVSRHHAKIVIDGAGMRLVDLGSRNGTFCNGVRVRERPLVDGDQIQLGDVVLKVAASGVGDPSAPPNWPARLRRIWTHGYFETRIEEECVRSNVQKTQFTLLRIRCPADSPHRAIEDCLANALRLVDVVGEYGPGEYEILLPGTGLMGGRVAEQRILAALKTAVGQATIGLATFPADGQAADELLSRAGNRARGEAEEETPSEPGLGQPSMAQLYQLVDRVAATDINVLLLGETGVGKEWMANVIHQRSKRAGKPYLALNVAALSESLLESELFGHERGAFTGAVQAKPGLLETADGGTVLLDEVGELPPQTQIKLLRVLETRQVMRVGGTKLITVDVRFVAATNRDLESDAGRGTFREDLFYRLNGVSLYVPPLRNRRTEIEGLVRMFSTEASRKYRNGAAVTIDPSAMQLLMRYEWPGNIRELRNVVERAVVIAPGQVVGMEQLPVERLNSTFASRSVATRRQNEVPRGAPHLLNTPPPAQPLAEPTPAPADRGLKDQVRALEEARIVDALAQCAGNQTRAAKLLGIARRTLTMKMEAYGISGPRKPR
jgi:two-component system response regulator AtoC